MLAMKRILVLFCSLAILCSCAEKVCTISGTLGYPADTVRLKTLYQELDKCAVKDGQFALQCPIDPTCRVFLFLNQDEYSAMELIPDAEEIQLTMTENETAISGSPLSQGLMDIRYWLIDSNKKYDKRFAEFMKAGNESGMEAVQAEKDKESADHFRELFLAHRNDELGRQAFDWLSGYLEDEEFLSLYKQAGQCIQDDALIGGYYERLTLPPDTEVITLQEKGTITREKGKFEDFVGHGSYTLVFFWATWFDPSKEELSQVVSVWKKYRDKGLVVLGVPVGQKQSVTIETMKEWGMHFPQLLDPSNSVARRYEDMVVSRSMLFDPEGNIVALDLAGSGIEEAVKEVIK